jgi:hypothetical protein
MPALQLLGSLRTDHAKTVRDRSFRTKIQGASRAQPGEVGRNSKEVSPSELAISHTLER